jgi:hypothetical protein
MPMSQLGPERLLAMRYQRVLRLPCDNIRNGISLKATLDLALKQLVEALFKPSNGFKIEFGDHTGGHLRAVITRGAEKFEVEGCYGQNSTFVDDKKVPFVSYTVRAEAALGANDPVASTSEGAELIGKVAGVVIAVALVCVLMSPVLKTSKFVFCLPLIAAAAYGGKLLGIKAVRILVGATQGGGTNAQSSAQGGAMWKRLTHAIESVTSSYPTA